MSANRNRKNIMTGVLVIALTLEGIAASGMTACAAALDAGEKEEVVYVMTTPEGKVESVNVVNIFGKGEVTDYGNYTTVKLLNTTEPIKQEGDKITFSTTKEKVYYQGTMENAELPWKISIQYTLDGKEISPEELAGKSGSLEIRLLIQKNEGCTGDFYENYALQAAITLDTTSCRNIQAAGATLANVGADKQISYTVLPGKGLDAVITADVEDFEMDAISINGIKLNLDIEVDDAELMDKVAEIMDATRDLKDGAKELSDGAADLADGGSSLSEGANSMYDGVSTLDTGIRTLKDGVSQMQDALNTLNTQSVNLTGGSAQVLGALCAIQEELSGVAVSTEQLKQLTDSSAAIKQGIDSVYQGALTLQAGLSEESYQAALLAGGLDMEALKARNEQTIAALSEQITQLSAAVEQLKGIPDYENDPAVVAQVTQIEAQLDSCSNMAVLLSANQGAIGGTSQYLAATAAGSAELVSGLEQLNNNYAAFDAAIQGLVNTLSDLVGKVNTLKAAIDTLVESYKTLNTGIQDYTGGVASILAAYSGIVTGTGELADGSRDLLNGSKELKEGSAELYDGIITLQDGTGQMQDGTDEFYEKTEGMDTEVEDKIDEMINSISGGSSETVSFVSAKNESVEAVQFVIKTAAIEKQEVTEEEQPLPQNKNLWQKLLDLFGI